MVLEYTREEEWEGVGRGIIKVGVNEGKGKGRLGTCAGKRQRMSGRGREEENQNEKEKEGKGMWVEGKENIDRNDFFQKIKLNKFIIERVAKEKRKCIISNLE